MNQVTHIIRSEVHPEAVLYRDVSIVDSKLSANCIVGDFSRVLNSELMRHVKIDRNNLVMSSTIDSYSYTGNFTVIQASQIGAYCSLSWGVSVGGGEHPLNRFTTHDILYNDRYGFDTCADIGAERYQDRVEIKNDVWIGANSVILRGVRIGNGAVVGAGAVVTKDIPDYGIAVGNPARLIRYRFSDAVIERLLASQWWLLDADKLRKHISFFRDADIEEFLEIVESL
jgi:virginiamycin A acetyltransferase